MKYYIVCLITSLLLLLILSACSFSTNNPPLSTVSPPVYPGAQQVKTGHPGGVTTVQVTTFQTLDKPAVVLTYYQNLLAKDGWVLNNDLSTPSKLDFSWGANGNARSTMYGLTITAEPTNSGNTDISIKLITYLPK